MRSVVARERAAAHCHHQICRTASGGYESPADNTCVGVRMREECVLIASFAQDTTRRVKLSPGLARAITGRTEMISSEANQKSAVMPDAAGVSEALPSLPPLPPTFPPGVDPATYQLETVSRLLKSAAYFSIFSIHNPNVPNIPIPSPRDPGSLIGIEANEELHRFEITVEEPTSECGLKATNRVGEAVASVHVKWMLIPDDFEAAPGRVPPPTELNPTRSQRFTFLDGQMKFKDHHGSGFRAFGAGRTFPVMIDNQLQLRVGAVVDVLEGFGKFKGLQGTVIVNGYLAPPQGLFLNFMIRLMDPAGKLRASPHLTSLRRIPDPDPRSTFLVFLGEDDPDNPTTPSFTPTGIRANVHELLRLVHINFDVGTSKGIRSRTTTGPIVGRLSTTLSFNPQDPNQVTPYTTSNGVFTFFDRRENPIGTLNADVVEGRAFRTELAGAPLPVFRFGGFGPFIGGTGPFTGALGMLSMNAVISVFPRTLSNLYVMRISDPDGKFRKAVGAAWS